MLSPVRFPDLRIEDVFYYLHGFFSSDVFKFDMFFRSLSITPFSASHEKLRPKLDLSRHENEVFNLQALRHMPNA